MNQILIVDDLSAMREQYAYDLRRLGGFETVEASDGKEALEILGSASVDCVLLDLEMPGMDGFEFLRRLRADGDETPVIVYTGTGNYDRCVQAIKLGATGFIDKAESMEKVTHEIQSAVERGRLVTQVRLLRAQIDPNSVLIGSSPPMQILRDGIARLAPIPSPVLVFGESGSGKELVARELHRLGPRAREIFLPLNSAAVPENLVESELFGHEAGSFTGAAKMRRGAFETASGGTLFLDEIGELPLPAQATLLRVLEDGLVTRVGGSKSIAVDTRVVAATNRDLEAEVIAGRFRQDLLYRLNVHELRVPALRERLSDVPLLIRHFLETLPVKLGLPAQQMTGSAVAALSAYSWKKNNVRELRNIIERMIIAAGGEEIELGHVPMEIRQQGDSPDSSPPAVADTLAPESFKELKARAEKTIVLAALERNNWRIKKTAADLGLSDHSSLNKIMRRHGLKKPE